LTHLVAEPLTIEREEFRAILFPQVSLGKMDPTDIILAIKVASEKTKRSRIIISSFFLEVLLPTFPHY
jgi:hypothetical protein